MLFFRNDYSRIFVPCDSLEFNDKNVFFRYDVDVEIESRHTIQITDVQIVQTSVKIYEDTA